MATRPISADFPYEPNFVEVHGSISRSYGTIITGFRHFDAADNSLRWGCLPQRNTDKEEMQ